MYIVLCKLHLYVFYIYLHVCWNNSVCLCESQMVMLDGVRAPSYHNGELKSFYWKIDGTQYIV